MRFASSTCADRRRGRAARGAVGAALLLLGCAVPTGLAVAASTISSPGTTAPWSARAIRSIPVPAGVRAIAVPLDRDPRATLDALERAGYHVDVAVAPGTYFVRAGRTASALPAGAVDLGAERSVEVHPPAAGAEGALPDAVLLPSPSSPSVARGPHAAAALNGLPQGARWEDTSEFMVGRVAVAILLPESDGDLDPNEFDWTPTLRDSVVSSAVRGCLKWTEFAANRGVALSFVLEVHPDLPTRYEPIRRPAGQVALWMAESMQTLVGYVGDADAMAYDVANAARARLGAQWAALCFGVQNDTTSVPGFPDGTSERARLGGPWFIVAVRHANPEGSTLDDYIEHEMGHMFWALDEYSLSTAWWACTLTTGYFNQPNWNSTVPQPGFCGPTEFCIMKGGGFYRDYLCPFTARQLGWVDRDQSGVLDLYETVPWVAPDSTRYDAALGVPVTVRGTVADGAWPNENPYRFGAGDSITVGTIDSLTYRLDGGSWTALAPVDGIFDSGEERFQVVLSPPTVGSHLLEFQARNSNGKSLPVPASTTITVSSTAAGPGGAGASGGPDLEVGPTPTSGSIRFALSARGSSTATARLYDVAGRSIRSWRVAVPAGGRAEWAWDGRLDRGGAAPGGVYFLVVETGESRMERRIVLLR
jgi:hypothetical protein